jgi:hypothetical protein
VLECLADGQGLREIGRRLEMSHTMVIKHRSNIAALLVELERPCILKHRFGLPNGAKDARSITHPNGRSSVNGTEDSGVGPSTS